MPAIASQVTRITSHAGLRYQIKQLRRQHPEVDIILIEPQPTDQRMFYGNIMHYQARLEVARHGFESVTLDLAEDYPSYKETLARHGVPITRRLVIEELAEIHNSGSDPAVIRRVLEARTHRMRPTSAQFAVLPAPTNACAIGAGAGRGGDGLIDFTPSAGTVAH